MVLLALAVVLGGQGTSGSSRWADPALAMSGTTWCGDMSQVVTLGDSQTSGQGASDYAHTWVSIADAALPGTWTNLAQNGLQVSDYLPGGTARAAVDQIVAARPGLVVVALGANEYLYDLSPETYRVNLRKLLDEIRDRTRTTSRPYGSSVLLVHTHGFSYRLVSSPVHWWGEYGYVQYQEAVARFGQGVRWLNLAAMTPWLDGDKLGLYQDSVHLSDRGHAVYAAAVLGRLTSC